MRSDVNEFMTVLQFSNEFLHFGKYYFKKGRFDMIFTPSNKKQTS
jgi:hypothetical protein